MAGSRSLGVLTLDLVAKTGGWVKGMNKAERRSKKWRKQVARDMQKVAKASKVVGAAVLGAAGTFAVLTKQGLAFVDSQAKLSARLGSSIDDLRALQIAASDFGVSNEKLERSLLSFTKRLGDASRGTGEAQAALKDLGLEASDLINMPLADQMALIAERISQLDSAAEKASIADRLMTGGRRMVNLFNDGGDAIRAAVQEVDDFGLSLSRVDAAKVEAANDAMSRIPRVLEPIKNQIAISLADPLTEVADLFQEAAKASNGFAAEVTEGLALAVETVGKMISGVDELRISLMKIQRFQLGVSAFAEQARLNAGQGMGRMSNYGLDNPPPETGPATERYNELSELIDEAEGGKNAFRDVAEWAREQADQIRAGYQARNLELDGIVDTSGALALFGDSAKKSADVVEEAARRQADAIKGVMPTKSQSAIPERVTASPAGLNLSSITPMGADQFSDGGPVPSGNFAGSVQSAAESASAGGVGKTHTIKFKVNEDDIGSVQGDDAFVKRLAGALGSVASAV